MKIETKFNKNYGKWFINNTLRAIKRYSMINPLQKVCVALSGGKDSITLLYILNYINHFTNLHFELYAAHVKTAEYDTSVLEEFCKALSVPYLETTLQDSNPKIHKMCSICARLKRGALSRLLTNNQITTAAFGHHADDVAETLLMNIFINKKLGSFSPVVSIPASPLKIIRPMIYLEAKTIVRLHAYAHLPLLRYDCPYSISNSRTIYREYLQQTASRFNIPDLSKRFVQSLENIDWTNIWNKDFHSSN